MAVAPGTQVCSDAPGACRSLLPLSGDPTTRIEKSGPVCQNVVASKVTCAMCMWACEDLGSQGCSCMYRCVHVSVAMCVMWTLHVVLWHACCGRTAGQ